MKLPSFDDGLIFYTVLGALILAFSSPVILSFYKIGKNITYYTSYLEDEATGHRCNVKTTKKRKRSYSSYRLSLLMKDGYLLSSTVGYRNLKDCKYKIGTKIPILRHPDDKSKGVVNTFAERWSFPLVVLSTYAFIIGWVYRNKGKQ